jgi:hypothetical protein
VTRPGIKQTKEVHEMATMLEYYEQALRLKEGQQIVIPCKSKKDSHSKRCGINNFRRSYNKRTGGYSDNIDMIAHEEEGKFYIILEKTSEEHEGAFIMNPDGSVEPFVNARVKQLNTIQEESEQYRELTLKEQLAERLKLEKEENRLKKEQQSIDIAEAKMDDGSIYTPENDDLDEFKQAMQDIHRNVKN